MLFSLPRNATVYCWSSGCLQPAARLRGVLVHQVPVRVRGSPLCEVTHRMRGVRDEAITRREQPLDSDRPARVYA